MKYLHKLSIPILLLCAGLVSCVDTKNAMYFNNIGDTSFVRYPSSGENKIQNFDILSIAISSLNAEASAVFNTPNNYVINSSSLNNTGSQSAGYLVNADGFIQMPLLGNVRAAGLTKAELKESITSTILQKKLLVDPVVTVRHLNFEVTVIGEVGHPTVITVPNERISMLKALGLAGDITTYGKKENVLLVREISGKKTIARLNLNASSFLQSPYYYLMPNDIVYVEPNKNKLASVNRGHQLLPSILYSLSVIAVLIVDRIK